MRALTRLSLREIIKPPQFNETMTLGSINISEDRAPITFASQRPVSKNMAVCDEVYVTIVVYFHGEHHWPIVLTWKKQVFNPPLTVVP